MDFRAGFTLLEVLIALAILSSVSLVVLRATGDNLTRIAANGWEDRATALGRDKLINLKAGGLKGNAQGNFGPDQPQLTWRASVTELDDGAGRLIALTVSEGDREISIEEIVFP
ncbi:MAG: prepilin-type N-terminal cleavage/methylation domain-containing protein [Desulfovibrio sp.]|nr:prepilin-type N-terminal cleavage/methylation domain-containing protein [Desulfovibrio sp.]